MKKAQNLNYFKKLLPKKLTVAIHKSDKGNLWAKIKELPHCYTQADSYFELIEMLNDAIYTYLEIPTKLMPKLGYYIPQEILQKLADEAKRQRWQKVVREIINQEQLKRKSTVFELSNIG